MRERRQTNTPARAAEYAHSTDFWADAEECKHKSEVLAQHCLQLDADFDAIVRSTNHHVVIGEAERDVQDRLGWIRAHYAPYLPCEQRDAAAASFAGGPAGRYAVAGFRTAHRLRKLGMTYAILSFVEAAYDRSGPELFNREVAPQLAAQLLFRSFPAASGPGIRGTSRPEFLQQPPGAAVLAAPAHQTHNDQCEQ